MARSRLPLILVLAVVTAAAAAFLPSPASAAAAGGEYCRDSLSGLLACKDFMFGGAPAASPACCAAYFAAFDADPFCLCYIANGVYGRSTGYEVNVTHALEIPVSCGLVTPPIALCNMEGLVLPPYEPSSAQHPAATPPQSPSAAKPAKSPSATPAQSPMAAPSLPQAPKPSSSPPFTSPPPMPQAPVPSSPPPFTSPPTSHGARGAAMGIGTVAAAVAVTLLA